MSIVTNLNALVCKILFFYTPYTIVGRVASTSDRRIDKQSTMVGAVALAACAFPTSAFLQRTDAKEADGENVKKITPYTVNFSGPKF